RLDIGVPGRGPPRRRVVVRIHPPIALSGPQNASFEAQNQYVAARNRPRRPPGTPLPGSLQGQSGKTALKVIASSIRKGNIIEQDGKLYVVLTAENIHPGKGTPV